MPISLRPPCHSLFLAHAKRCFATAPTLSVVCGSLYLSLGATHGVRLLLRIIYEKAGLGVLFFPHLFSLSERVFPEFVCLGQSFFFAEGQLGFQVVNLRNTFFAMQRQRHV